MRKGPSFTQLAVTGMAGFALACAALAQPADSAVRTPGQREQFGSQVREYLLQNPEIIREVMQLLIQREQAARANAQKSALAANRAFLFEDAGAPYAGNPQGDVTIVEFFDYRCPHCMRVIPVVDALLRSDPKVKVVYRDFPVLGPDSVFSARFALAAHRQGRYLEARKSLFEQSVADEAGAMALGKRLGLDTRRLAADLNDQSLLGELVRIQEVAQTLGINGTPAFVVSDRLVPGAADLETLQKLVADVRARR